MKVFLLTVATLFQRFSLPNKVPRIYNALITTDQKLTPSQAFPALQPYISVPYPIFVPFKQPVIPEELGESRDSVSRTYLPSSNDPVPKNEDFLDSQLPPHDDGPFIDLYGNAYDHAGKIVNSGPQDEAQSGESSPQTGESSSTRTDRSFLANDANIESYQRQNQVDNGVRKSSDDRSDVRRNGDSQDEGFSNNYVKNNRPSDPNIIDVPPPPPPVTGTRKKFDLPEEYPPPPVPFF